MRNDTPLDARQRAGNGAALSFGMTFAAGMAVFTVAGWWIDKRRGGGVAFTLAGVFLGLGYGGYELWKLIRLLQSGQEKNGRDEDSERNGGKK